MPAAVTRKSARADSARAIEIYPDSDALIRAAAERIVTCATRAICARGLFAISLAGGATPRPLYELLALPRWASQIDWSRVHVFWGDERCVPPDHEQSNYRMARAALLDHVAIPAANVYRIAGEAEPDHAARAYEQTLRAFFGCPEGPPDFSFDLALLGMGDDGHTASMFPGTAPVIEAWRWVMPNHASHAAGTPAAWRITLTPVVFDAAREVAFLISGTAKAARLAEALEDEGAQGTLPALRIQPTHGDVTWMVDAAAASHLRRTP